MQVSGKFDSISVFTIQTLMISFASSEDNHHFCLQNTILEALRDTQL